MLKLAKIKKPKPKKLSAKAAYELAVKLTAQMDGGEMF